MFGAAKRDRSFKDYCLILQVHPEADAAMVDAAYWHLAKRYNEASAYDPQARAKLEELNEAYIVLGSAEKREEYMKVRAEVLGEGALPQAPRPAPRKPPLAVMSRQHPQQRAPLEVADARQTSRSARNAAGVFVILGLLGVALAAMVSLPIAGAVVGLAFVAILAVTGAVVGLPRLQGASHARGPRSIRQPGLSGRPGRAGTGGDPLGKIKSQAEQVRRISTEAEGPPDESMSRQAVDAGRPDEFDFQPSPSDTAAVNAAEAAVADSKDASQSDESKDRSGQWPSAGEPQPMNDDQVEKLKQQTQRLRNIASKFNAAKGEARPDATPKD
jgi:curved DNA-binding protein CbpA